MLIVEDLVEEVLSLNVVFWCGKWCFGVGEDLLEVVGVLVFLVCMWLMSCLMILFGCLCVFCVMVVIFVLVIYV